MTFNRGFQKTLAFPGIFEAIHVEPSSGSYQSEVYYFLKAVRNVNRLTFDKAVTWPAGAVQLFSTLNPQDLDLYTSLVDANAISLLNRCKNDTADKVERHISHLLTPLLLPKLSRLAHRLMQLRLFSGPPLVDNKVRISYLESLWKPQATQDRDSYYRFPPTLTSLVIGDSINELAWNAISSALPDTIRTLSIRATFSLDVASLITKFPLMEDFFCGPAIGGPEQPQWSKDGSTQKIPDTLDRFAFEVASPSQAISLLEDSNLTNSKATVFELRTIFERPDAGDQKPVLMDLKALLPSSITEASVILVAADIAQSARWCISSLPQNLTTLVVRQNVSNPLFLTALRSLQHLTTLKLIIENHIDIIGSKDSPVPRNSPPGFPALRPVPIALFSLVPKTVTRFEVRGSRLPPPKSAVRDLPPSLISLTLPSFDLSRVEDMRNHLPRCYLVLSEPVKLWTSKNGELLRSAKVSKSWSSAVSLDTWADEVTRHYSDLMVHFRVNYESVPRLDLAAALKSSPEVKELSLSTDLSLHHGTVTTSLRSVIQHHHVFAGYPNLQKLVLSIPGKSAVRRNLTMSDLPPSLTHLEVFDSQVNIWLCGTATPRLAYIATNSTCGDATRDWKPPSSLTYLDAPKWKLKSKNVLEWSLLGYEKFIAGVYLADYEVAEFLVGGNIDQKTRSNMDVTITYRPTGLLVPTRGGSAAWDITWESIKERTNTFLMELLRVKTPSDKASHRIRGFKDTIGAVVKRLSCDEELHEHTIRIPYSAQVVSLMAPKGVKWSLGTVSSKKIRAGTLKRPLQWNMEAGMESAYFFSNLVRLELGGILKFQVLASSLPKSLMYFKLSLTISDFRIDMHKLSRLKVLIIQQERKSKRESTQLRLGRDSLPSSLKHLALVAPVITGEDHHNGAKTKIDLPRLKNALFEANVIENLDVAHFHEKASKGLKNIDLVCTAGTNIGSVQGKSKITVHHHDDPTNSSFLSQFCSDIESTWER